MGDIKAIFYGVYLERIEKQKSGYKSHKYLFLLLLSTRIRNDEVLVLDYKKILIHKIEKLVSEEFKQKV